MVPRELTAVMYAETTKEESQVDPGSCYDDKGYLKNDATIYKYCQITRKNNQNDKSKVDPNQAEEEKEAEIANIDLSSVAKISEYIDEPMMKTPDVETITDNHILSYIIRSKNITQHVKCPKICSDTPVIRRYALLIKERHEVFLKREEGRPTPPHKEGGKTYSPQRRRDDVLPTKEEERRTPPKRRRTPYSPQRRKDDGLPTKEEGRHTPHKGGGTTYSPQRRRDDILLTMEEGRRIPHKGGRTK